MWNPFKKTPGQENVYAPVQGRVVTLDEVPDPVFARRSMGDGFAVEPSEGTFRAPVNGELILVAKTLHAFAIRTDAGAEVLVHIGIDTVKLKGAGFTAQRAQGDRVKVGDPVITCDLADMAGKVPSMTTPVIVTNGKAFTISVTDLTASEGAPVAAVARV